MASGNEMGALFERTIEERIDSIGKVLESERKQREHMHSRHPERGEYWQGRIAEIDLALADLAVIKAEARSNGLRSE